MPELQSALTSFSGGEWSPKLFGRSDVDKYRSSLEEVRNFVVQKHGGLMRRSGSRFVTEVKDSSKFTRLLKFEFSVSETYQFEFGDQYVRFMRDKGQLKHGTIFTVTAIAESGGTSTLTIGSHTLQTGDTISVQDVLTNDADFPRGYNGTFTVTSVAPTTVSYANTPDPLGTFVSGGTAVNITGTIPTEIVTPWTTAQLPLVKITQSYDILYVTHPEHEPRLIKRTAGADSDPAIWKVEEYNAEDGPYLPINLDDTATLEIPMGAKGGTITIITDALGKAVALINDGQGFLTTDVGRTIRWQDGLAMNVWRWGTISFRNSRTSIDVVLGTDTTGAPTITAVWRLGAWSDTDGWPFCLVFDEDRLWFGGTPRYGALYGSVIGDYHNHSPTDEDGDVLATSALNLPIDSDSKNTINWLTSHVLGIIVHTDGGLFVSESTDESVSITATTYRVRRVLTEPASQRAQPQVISGATLVPSRSNRRVWEFVFRGELQPIVAPDLTILAEHITLSGLIDTALQTEPDNIMWCVRADGVMASMTYERSDGVVAWHRHILGGVFLGGEAVVESVSVIRDGDDDLVWIIVKRTINGVTKRYVEFLEPLFADDARGEDGVFVDSALTSDIPIAMTGATATDPVVITATDHGLSNGATVRIRDVVGMTDTDGKSLLNDRSFTVANAASNTFELTDEDGADIDGTEFSLYVTGGTVRLEFTEIAGLDHLAGETVRILTDGKAHPDKVVTSGGVITLDVKASIVHVGLAFPTRATPLPIIPASGFETRGRTKRIDHAVIRLNRSIGGNLGDFAKFPIVTRIPSDLMGQPTPLFTGTIRQAVSARHSIDALITVETSDAFPMNLLSMDLEMAADGL